MQASYHEPWLIHILVYQAIPLPYDIYLLPTCMQEVKVVRLDRLMHVHAATIGRSFNCIV